ncbi:SDR family NAD(P)-dependent oxidoreductase [Dactylosporangium roseum]|uniref:SDR family NAD(P)-dependent oxidoreductase n=1 Tax=Dactylosporangium roseum TaxID=47989 RepID=A0ABY5ZF12_9ACTN|nr:SDR family NAD(P)-dependent oxidoreductase [Dactylosporangium roseum]
MVVTGASAGIGLAGAKQLAAHGDRLILLGRDESRLAVAAEVVRAAGRHRPIAIRADFADLAQVRAAAVRIRDSCDRVDVLVNNAGGLFGGVTGHGHDRAMQVNHLAGFLLAHLLLDRMRRTSGPPSRLITTASLAEAWGVLDVDAPMRKRLLHRSRWLAYGSSKQANILFTLEAARRWTGSGVLPLAFFPGLVRSRFASTSPLFMLGKLVPVLFTSPARAADTLTWLATAPESALVPGGYYFLRQPFAATARSTSPSRAERLWNASLQAAGEWDLPPDR